MKRKKTPSQLKRNKKRMEIFNSKKAKEAGKLESLTEYALKMEAHVNCTTEDIVEAIETNYFGILGLDKTKIGEKLDLKYLKVQKLEENQLIGKTEDKCKDLKVFKVSTKDIDEARTTIESWREDHKFDDFAFRNSDCRNMKINVRGVSRLR